jgi:hypothetical protein
VGDRLPLPARLLHPVGVAPILTLGDLPVEGAQAGPVGPLGLLVQDGVGAEGQPGPGQPAAAGQGDQLGRGHRLTGPGEQHGQVVHALGVGQLHRVAVVAEGPGGAGAAEHCPPGRDVAQQLPRPAGQRLQPHTLCLSLDGQEQAAGALPVLGFGRQHGGQLQLAPQPPGPGAEPLVHGHRRLQVAAGQLGTAGGRGQQAEIVGHGAQEQHGPAGNGGAGLVGQQRLIPAGAGLGGAEGGVELGQDDRAPSPGPVPRHVVGVDLEGGPGVGVGPGRPLPAQCQRHPGPWPGRWRAHPGDQAVDRVQQFGRRAAAQAVDARAQPSGHVVHVRDLELLAVPADLGGQAVGELKVIGQHGQRRLPGAAQPAHPDQAGAAGPPGELPQQGHAPRLAHLEQGGGRSS